MVAAPLLSRIKKRPWLWSLVVIAAFMGALPDLIGAHGNFIRDDHWAEYRVAHAGSIAEVLKYIPMYGLHLYLDSLTHQEGHRWWKWNERLWLEVLLWVVNFLVIAWMVRRWNHITQSRCNNV